jgi:hypothetical protein
LGVAALIYFGLLLILAVFQRRMIYLPSQGSEPDLIQLAAGEGLAPWRDAEHNLIGWRSPPADNASTQAVQRLLVFHGNAGFALARTYYVEGFRSVSGDGANWEVYLFEYPGYGARPGKPSEEAILAAARQALDELLRAKPDRLYLLGESLGGSIATRLAAERPEQVAGLVLVTPFPRLADVAAHHYPIFPIRLILREGHEVQAHLNTFPGPVAFVLAGRDEIIPAPLGRELFERYPGRKALWTQPDAGHNTLELAPGEVWWRQLSGFLRQHAD